MKKSILNVSWTEICSRLQKELLKHNKIIDDKYWEGQGLTKQGYTQTRLQGYTQTACTN